MNSKRNFEAVLVIIVGLIIIYLISHNDVFLIIGLSLGIVVLLFNKSAEYISKFWYGIGELLGKIISPLILAIIFYFFLFPLSLLYRIGKKDPLAIKRKERISIWRQRDHLFTKTDMEKPF